MTTEPAEPPAPITIEQCADGGYIARRGRQVCKANDDITDLLTWVARQFNRQAEGPRKPGFLAG